jgi:hypothetical protein
MVAPLGALRRLNTKAFVGLSVAWAWLVKMRVVPSVTVWGRMGSITTPPIGVTELVVTVTVNVMVLEFCPKLCKSKAATVRLVVPTCVVVGVQVKRELVMLMGLKLAPTGQPERGSGWKTTWLGEIMSVLKTEILIVSVVPASTFVGLTGLITIGLAPRAGGDQIKRPPSSRSVGMETAGKRPCCERRGPRSGIA